MGKVQSFEDLIVWQESQNLAVSVYKVTKSFPADEQFGLTSQIRRASSSISANIAEGFGRRSQKDKQHFYTMAYGSLLEVKNFLYLTKRLEYLEDKSFELLIDQCMKCQKLIIASKNSLSK